VARASVLDRAALSGLIGGSLVMHLASVVGVRRVLADPAQAFRVADRGTRNVLELCAERDIPAVLFSSSEVYGPDREDRLGESALEDPLPGDDPRFAYALGKRMAERHARDLVAQRGLHALVVRPFNIAGPGQDPAAGMVVARFCHAALHDEPLLVHGDGRQTRCFLHVRDAVEMTLALAACDAAFGQVVNLGSEEEVSILELAHRVIALSGSRSRIVHVSYESVFARAHRDFRRRRPDLRRLRSLIGAQPHRSLDHIILDTLEHGRTRSAAARVASPVPG
jgi:UDP-glucose 4-epimerase